MTSMTAMRAALTAAGQPPNIDDPYQISLAFDALHRSDTLGVVARKTAVADAMANLRAHPMCVRLIDASPRFLMTVPEGFSISGIRCDYSINGRAWALRMMLARAEQYWSMDRD